MDPYLRQQSKLDRDLVLLRDNVLRLSDMTGQAINQAVRALKDLDVALAQEIISGDGRLNKLRYDIEQQGYHILATQQPTARDMRSLITAIHIAVELERIADYAAGIGQLTIKLSDGPIFKPTPEFTSMLHITQQMLTAALDAYVNWDAALAHNTSKRDDEVDELDKQAYQKLVSIMSQDPRNIQCGTYLLWIGHNLERMADRVTNICERVIFMVTGELMIGYND